MEIQSLFNLVSFFVLVFLVLFKANNRPKTLKDTAKRLPPGPWKLPFIGSLHHLLLGSVPHRILRDLAKKHGPLMHLQLGECPAVVVSSPRLAKEVMKERDPSFADRPDFLATRIMFYDYTDVGFAPYGDYWRQMRKICIVELLSAKKVKSFSRIRESEVHRLVDSVRSSIGKPINLTDKICSMSGDITCRSAFGKICRNQGVLIYLMKQVIALSGGFDVADLFPSKKILHFLSGTKPKLVKMHRKLDEILEAIIKEHVENHNKSSNSSSKNNKGNGEEGEEDIIDVLLRVMGSGELEIPINTQNIKGIIFDMFSGGTETSSTELIWIMCELMRNPRVMKKVQAELRQEFKGKQVIYESDIQNLTFLRMVIKESLRLHPPFCLIPRQSREECEIDGYTIPNKSKIMINYWSIGRNPDYWKDAESFIPERFQDNSVDFMGTNFEFAPFGAGKRMCPGLQFGLVSIELPLAQLLYHFNWELPRGINPEDLDMSENPGLTVGRKNMLFLIPKSVQP